MEKISRKLTLSRTEISVIVRVFLNAPLRAVFGFVA